MRQTQEKFNEIWALYKAQFGNTFSYFDVARDEDAMKAATPLMQAALDGNRSAITDKEFGALPDDEALS